MDIEQKKKDRFIFLEKLYKITDGSPAYSVNMWELGAELGFARERTSNIVDYLIGENLIEFRGLGGGIEITHYGVVEIEESHGNPNSPTEHFPPINVIHVENMNNSAIQQGTNHSSQNVSFNTERSDELNQIIKEIEKLKELLEFDKIIFDELISEIDTLKSQVKSPKPKNIIIMESLKTIRNILDGVAGNSMTPVIIGMINNLIG